MASAKEAVYRALSSRAIVKDFITKYGEKLKAAGVLDTAPLDAQTLGARRTRLSDKPVKIRKLIFPEDNLIRELFRRYPEMREIPVDIYSAELHPAKKFGLLQLELMEGPSKLDKERAFEEAFKQLGLDEFVSQARNRIKVEEDIIAVIQAEEEQVLRDALSTRLGQAFAAQGSSPSSSSKNETPKNESDGGLDFGMALAEDASASARGGQDGAHSADSNKRSLRTPRKGKRRGGEEAEGGEMGGDKVSGNPPSISFSSFVDRAAFGRRNQAIFKQFVEGQEAENGGKDGKD